MILNACTVGGAGASVGVPPRNDLMSCGGDVEPSVPRDVGPTFSMYLLVTIAANSLGITKTNTTAALALYTLASGNDECTLLIIPVNVA